MADEGQEDAAPAVPPWNWRDRRLTEDERRAELEDLAEWVLGIQVAFGHWVRVPPCWACHRGLRAELAAFWYWRQHLDRTPQASAEENVRWFQQLRSSAHAWAEAYAGCHHESLGELDERRTDRDAERTAARPFLDRALEEPKEC